MVNSRTVFMGSPDFAATILRSLIGNVNLVGVVTQPDRPAGRGKNLSPPPVKQIALDHDLPVIQPEKLRKPEAYDQLAAWKPELIIVAAYGQILRQNVLDLPLFGCINLHASLLPRWRGAAPIQAAILNGDRETGVTIMKMDAGVDTGDIYVQKVEPIYSDDDSISLAGRLALIGGELLLKTLPGIISGTIQHNPQNNEIATYAPLISKEDGVLDFSLPAVGLERRVRAFKPWPGTVLNFYQQPLKVLKARIESESSLTPGQRGIIQGFPAVGSVEGALVLEEVQPAGRKSMPGNMFLNGAKNWVEKHE